MEGAGKSGVGGPGLGSLIPAFARVLITSAGGSVFGQENGRYPNFEILSSPNFLNPKFYDVWQLSGKVYHTKHQVSFY